MLGVPLVLYVDSTHAFLTDSGTSGGVGFGGFGFFGAITLVAALAATKVIIYEI